MLTWSSDETARLWQATDGTAIGQPMRHEPSTMGVLGAIFTKDEQRVLTWGDDGTARLWQAKDGTSIGQPIKQLGILGATFSKDEQQVLTWGSGEAQLWHVGEDYDFPTDRMPLLVEVITGTTMDNSGNIRALDRSAWNERRKQYLKVAEDHYRDCQFKTANLYTEQNKLWGPP